jgi:putative transposase
MARPLRVEYAGALHHVTSRGNEQRKIFHSNRDREKFLEYLGQAVKRFGWLVSAWVLMTNHFHLVVETPEPNLSRGMQWLNGTYAAWFNKRHRRSGHLFQGRFHSVLVEKQSYFAEVIRYVVLNPVRANMVQRPEDYRWSSYRATAGLEKAPAWFDVDHVLAVFGDGVDRVAEYRLFVEMKIHSEERLWDEVTNVIYLGREEWIHKMRATVESKPRSSDHPLAQRAVGRPKMANVVAAVADVAKISAEEIRSKRGGALRRLAAWLGWNEGLLTLRSIAAGLRLRSEGYVSNLIRRIEHELCSDLDLLAHLDAATAVLRA